MAHAVGLATRTVLVVEDEWLIRMEIADAFEAAGWTVLEASTGEEATALSATLYDFALLITDIRLGVGLTGWDVADHWRRIMPQIGVIYASANPAIETRVVDGGIFIGKPVRMRDLLSLGDQLSRR